MADLGLLELDFEEVVELFFVGFVMRGPPARMAGGLRGLRGLDCCVDLNVSHAVGQPGGIDVAD